MTGPRITCRMVKITIRMSTTQRRLADNGPVSPELSAYDPAPAYASSASAERAMKLNQNNKITAEKSRRGLRLSDETRKKSRRGLRFSDETWRKVGGASGF